MGGGGGQTPSQMHGEILEILCVSWCVTCWLSRGDSATRCGCGSVRLFTIPSTLFFVRDARGKCVFGDLKLRTVAGSATLSWAIV